MITLCSVMLCIEFQYDPDTFDVTPEMQEVFDWDGCFIVRYAVAAVYLSLILVEVLILTNLPSVL